MTNAKQVTLNVANDFPKETPYQQLLLHGQKPRYDRFDALHIERAYPIVFMATGEVAIIGIPRPHLRQKYTPYGFSICTSVDKDWSFYEDIEDTSALKAAMIYQKPVELTPIPKAQLYNNGAQCFLVCNATGRAVTLKYHRTDALHGGTPLYLSRAAGYLNYRASEPRGHAVVRRRPVERREIADRFQWLQAAHEQVKVELMLMNNNERTTMLGRTHYDPAQQVWTNTSQAAAYWAKELQTEGTRAAADPRDAAHALLHQSHDYAYAARQVLQDIAYEPRVSRISRERLVEDLQHIIAIPTAERSE